MTVSQNQLNHYKSVLQNSLDNFIKAVEETQKDQRYEIIVSEWESLMKNEEKIKLLAENVESVASLIGFGREFSKNMNYENIVSRVAERFAEIDLAIHAIREFKIPDKTEKLEKLAEQGEQVCDFRLKNPPYYFEAKYTKNITTQSLRKKTEEALVQIKVSMAQDDTSGTGVVWTFTYESPLDPSSFQDEVMSIKGELGGELDLRINVQTYSMGMYGDATAV